MAQKLIDKCLEKGIRMTEQRRIIAGVISSAHDHPSVEEVYERANSIDSKISIATVYRTVKLLEEEGILTRHDFGGNKSRYEEHTEEHHDHLIDIRTGSVIEFVNEEIEKLQERIANEYGYTLVDHRLELYCIPKGEK
jgi:Fur family ferric uptake transcriptional regulator